MAGVSTMTTKPVAAPATLGTLFDARSVAVVGASGDPGRIGGRPVAYMKALGYSGEILPVNPTRTEVQGLPAYPSLTAIGRPVDLVVIATPADTVETALKEAVEIGAKGAVIFSSGFSELDQHGADRQRRLSEIAHAGGLRLIGPNCLGLFDTRSRIAATFTTALESLDIAVGGFACVSQSGALAAYWLDMVRQAGIGVSRWISTGNEGGVSVADALAFLAEDDATGVIGMYIEDIKDGERFRAAALAARRAGKPVLAIKAGRSAAGAMAAASHTGALSGEFASYEAFFRQFGIVSVRSLSEMVQVAKLHLAGAVPAGDRIGIVSVSGGAGVMLADAAHLAGFSVEPLWQATRAALGDVLPSFAKPQNPIDLTGSVVQQRDVFRQALHIVATAPELDAVVLFIGLMHSIADELAEGLAAIYAAAGKPVVVVWVGAPPAVVHRLEAAGIVVFPDIPEAIAALAAARAPGRATIHGGPLPEGSLAAPDGPHRALAEHAAKRLVADVGGVAVPEGRLLRSAAEIGPELRDGRWVAKLQSADVLHKSDLGAVRLGLQGLKGIREAVEDLLTLGERLQVPVDGVLVERMVPFVLELVIGLRRDPTFGPMLVVGRGGTSVELEPDVAIGFLPLDDRDVEALLRSLRCAPLFDGFRGRPAVDVAAAAAAIGRQARAFLADPSLIELEINPLVLPAAGDGPPMALDALARVAGR